MPIKSLAQRQKLQEMLAKGQISRAQYEEWERGTPEDLPERVPPRPEKRKTKVHKVRVK